jgi:hypothetical protein
MAEALFAYRPAAHAIFPAGWRNTQLRGPKFADGRADSDAGAAGVGSAFGALSAALRRDLGQPAPFAIGRPLAS